MLKSFAIAALFLLAVSFNLAGETITLFEGQHLTIDAPIPADTAPNAQNFTGVLRLCDGPLNRLDICPVGGHVSDWIYWFLNPDMKTTTVVMCSDEGEVDEPNCMMTLDLPGFNLGPLMMDIQEAAFEGGIEKTTYTPTCPPPSGTGAVTVGCIPGREITYVFISDTPEPRTCGPLRSCHPAPGDIRLPEPQTAASLAR